MNRLHVRLLLGFAAASACGIASAAVTLTDTTQVVKGETVPVWVMENQWVKVAIIKDTVPETLTNTANGQVLSYIVKTSSQPTTSQLTFIQTTAPYVSQANSYIAYRDRFGGSWPSGAGGGPGVLDPQVPATVTAATEEGGTVAAVTVDELGGNTGPVPLTIQKIYRLRDNTKYMEVQYKWVNATGTDYYRGDPQNSIDPLIYVAPGGTSGTADPKDTVFIKTRTAFGSAISTLTATNASNYYGGRKNTGAAGPGTGQEPVEGWIGVIDPAASIAMVNTWDIAKQRASLHPAGAAEPYTSEAVVRGGIFSNRTTFEVFWPYIPANTTLDFTMAMIGDTGLSSIGYAKEGQLIAAIATDFVQYNPATKPIANATFTLNSLNPTSPVIYDLRNIRVEDASTGPLAIPYTLSDITGVTVASNAHVTAATVPIDLVAANLTSGRNYVVKADLYVSGETLPITTIISTPFLVDNAVVHLYLGTDGNILLENEYIRYLINPANGQIKNLLLLSNGRNQTVTAIPGYPLFQDYVKGGAISPATINQNPGSVNSLTKKAISFSTTVSGVGAFTKLYTLESLSKSLQVDFTLANTASGNVAIPGEMLYSKVFMNPGGTAGSNDLTTTHTVDGFFYNHPIGGGRRVFGASVDSLGNAVTGDQSEMDQPWVAVADRSATDALAYSWDLAKQKQFSPKPDGTTPVTYNVIDQNGDINYQSTEVHYVNLAAGATFTTTAYLMGDTNFRLIGFAQGKRVMAGLWTDLSNDPAAANAYQGTGLPFHIGLTSTDVANRTFDVKNLRLVDSFNTSVPAGADLTGVTLTPGQQVITNLSAIIPANKPLDVYTVQADLYEGGTLVSTLKTLPFNLIAGPSGDVDGSGTVDVQDVTKALKIAAGLDSADLTNVTNGDVSPTGGDLAITITDAVALARKVAGL